MSVNNLQAVLGGQNIKLLEVKIEKMISKDLFIIADNTAACLLTVSDQDFKLGETLRILKPKKVNNDQISADPKVKPVRSFKSIQITPVKAKRLAELQAAGHDITSSPAVGLLIKDIKHLPEKAPVPFMTLFVSSMSRVIPGNFGPYQTANIKDFNGDTSSLMISGKHVTEVPVQAVIQCTMLVKSKKADENGEFKRVATTNTTKITMASPSLSATFLSRKLGEFSFSGTVFGCADVQFSPSCPK